MSSPIYKIEPPSRFSEKEKQIFVGLLRQQRKVLNPSIKKLNFCSFLCSCVVNDSIISIGAIKPKTVSDFSPAKANIESLANSFDFELGYCFTLPQHTRQGFSSKTVELLVGAVKENNLMASTELNNQNSMLRILERNGFKQFGSPWRSTIHNGILGLFLRFSR